MSAAAAYGELAVGGHQQLMVLLTPGGLRHSDSVINMLAVEMYDRQDEGIHA
jgi:hypothetical protein